MVERTLLWTARIAAVLLACFYLMFVIAEFLFPHSGPPTSVREWAGLAVLALVFVGMLVALRWQLFGAVLSLASLAAFCVIIKPLAPVLIAGIPGVLFLAHSYLKSREGRNSTTGAGSAEARTGQE